LASPDPAQRAVERARERARSGRAEGAYGDELGGFEVEPIDRADRAQLLRWALISPDAAGIYTTRRLGRPIVLVKRALLRLLRQYHHDVLGQQSRFNAQVVDRLLDLERRVAELERRAGGDPPA